MTKLIQPIEVQLSNGISVVLQHYESSVAATYWWVKVGSADERPEEAGFAHFLEHMLFKDASAKETGRASTGQMARMIESLGGDINAYTSFDQTVYHVTSAAQHWERVLDAFGTMAKPQKFLKEDFEKEREVILEELKKNEDSPGRQLFQTLFSGTFSKHPYGRPVIGYEKVLKAAKTSQLEKFYRRNYVAGKMGIVLVGPLEDEKGTRKKNILKLLEKHFGAKVLRKSPVEKRERPVEVELRDRANWKIRDFDVKTPTLSFSFRVPNLSHEDLPALDLLSSVLGMGELSRLYQRLFYQTSLVTDISGGLYVPHDPGMMYFQAEVDSMDKLKPVAEEMFKELKRMAEEGPTIEELSRVLVNGESERLYATQTADGMAGRLGFLKYILGDLQFDREYLDQLRAVDASKIKEVARKYFDYRRMSGVILVPKAHASFDVSEIEQIATQILSVEDQSLFTIQRAKKGKSASSKNQVPVEVIRMPSGLQVCYHPRKQSHVFSAHASVLGGLRLELAHPIETAERDWGSSYMMSLVWAKGTSKYDSKRISEIIEGRAASLEGFAGRNSVGIQMTGLARDWNTLSQITADVLLDPIFPEEEVEHARRIAEDSVRSVDDHTSQLCSKLFLETLFQHHPYGKMTHGSLESLKTMTSKKLKAFHEEWIRPERLVLSVSGAVKDSELESWIYQFDQKAQSLLKRSNAAALPGKLMSEPDLSAPRWVEKSLSREQCHLLVGGLGCQIYSEDRFVLRLLQTLLGGQSGRLFIELREKKSLAYTVAPISFEGLERGYVGTYIACSPQKKEEAIAGIRTVLEKLAEKGPSAQEMERAKEFFLGRRSMDLQSDPSIAGHFGLETLYQVTHLTDEQMSKKIRAITAKQISQICRKYLVEPHMVISAVG